MSPKHKKIIWLLGTPTSPPLGTNARIETGYLFRQLQSGVCLGMPQSRPMPSIGKGCHELRITDEKKIWRFFYFIDSDAIVLLDWGVKKSQKTSKKQLDVCKKRLKEYQLVGK